MPEKTAVNEVPTAWILRNPLLSLETNPCLNWHECLMRFQKPDADHVGLLHQGMSLSLEHQDYNEPRYDKIDRLIFYFSVADGWNDASQLKVPGTCEGEYRMGHDSAGNPISKTIKDLRQEVACKAFDMLCLNFFRTDLSEEDHGSGRFGWMWEQVIASERLLPVIQCFFRIEKQYDRHKPRNLSQPFATERQRNNHRYVLQFVENLVRFVWSWQAPVTWEKGDAKREFDAKHAPMRSRLDGAKPWLIELLVALKKLELLRKFQFGIDEACVAKLQEIAMRTKLNTNPYGFSEDRLVQDLDEAVASGSAAARFLVELKIAQKVNARLIAIHKAEQVRRKAEETLLALTKK